MSKVLPTYESLPSCVRTWLDHNPYSVMRKGYALEWCGTKTECEKWLDLQEFDLKDYKVIETPIECGLAEKGYLTIQKQKWESYGIPFSFQSDTTEVHEYGRENFSIHGSENQEEK